MLTNKAMLLAASGPSKYTVIATATDPIHGQIFSATYTLKIGESVTVCPDYIESQDLPPGVDTAHGFYVWPTLELDTWRRCELVNGFWVLTLTGAPFSNPGIVAFEAMEDGGG